MRKVLFATAILLASFVAQQADAQTLPAGIVLVNDLYGAPSNIGGVNLVVTASQAPTAGGPVSAEMTTLSSGGTLGVDMAEPLGSADYWVTPSPTQPLTLTIGSGYTVRATNGTGVANVFFVRVTYFNEAGNPVNTNGSLVSVAAGQTVSLPIPSISAVYNAALPVNSTYGYPTPIGIAVLANE